MELIGGTATCGRRLRKENSRIHQPPQSKVIRLSLRESESFDRVSWQLMYEGSNQKFGDHNFYIEDQNKSLFDWLK